MYSQIKESTTENIDTNQSLEELPQIFIGLQLTIFKPREFYSIEIFAVQFMSRQSCFAMCKVLCIFVQGFLPTLSLPVYQNADVNSVCEKVYCIRWLFFFSVPLLTYKYKGKYVLKRIPHASDGWKLKSFRYLE